MIRSRIFSLPMVRAHLKCFSGHDLKPCNPQGLQLSVSTVSIIAEFSESGPKPKAGTVEQKIAVTGAFIAEAKCCGAESFTKFIAASRIRAADCINVSLPDKLIEF